MARILLGDRSQERKGKEMSKVIGYMEGTDPVLLTTLAVNGCSVEPFSNGIDGHGLSIQMIHKERKPDLIVCHLHKLLPSPGMDITVSKLLYRPCVFGIPIIIICPKECQEKVGELAPDLPDCAYLADPADVISKIREMIE